MRLQKFGSGFNLEPSALSPKLFKMSLSCSPPGLVSSLWPNLKIRAFCSPAASFWSSCGWDKVREKDHGNEVIGAYVTLKNAEN